MAYSTSWIVGLPGRGPTTLSLQTGSGALNSGRNANASCFPFCFGPKCVSSVGSLCHNNALLSMVVAIQSSVSSVPARLRNLLSPTVANGCSTQEDAKEGGYWGPQAQSITRVVFANEFGCWFWPGPSFTCWSSPEVSSRSCSSCSSTPCCTCCSPEEWHALRGFGFIGIWWNWWVGLSTGN